MPLAVRQRNVAPTGAVMQAPATPIGINSNEYNAIQGTIAAGTNLVLSQADRVMKAEMSSEMADFQGFVATQKAEAAKFRQENEDEDLPDLKSTKYKQDWEARQKLIEERKERLKYVDTKRAANEYIAVNKPAWEHGVEQDGFASKIDKAQRKFIEFQGTVLNEDYRDELLAENSIRKQNGQPELTDRQYRTSLITQKANELANTGVIDQRDVPGIIAKFENSIETMQVAELKTNVEMTAFQIAKDSGYEEAEKWLRNPQTELDLLKLGVKREDVKSLLVDIEERVGDQKTQDKEITVSKQQEIGNDIFNSFQSNDLTKARELINSGKDGIQLEPTGENSKQYWSNILKSAKVEAENPYANTTDDNAYLSVTNTIGDYRNGIITREKAYNILTQNKSKLDESDYKNLRSVFDKEVEGKQVKKLNSEMRVRYQNVLETQVKAGLFGEVEDIGTQRLYMAKADQISQWFDNNPEPNPKEAQAFFNNITKEEVKSGFFSKVGEFLTPPPIKVLRIMRAKKQLEELQKDNSENVIGGYQKPTSKEEFLINVGKLKASNNDDAKKYFSKWVGEFE